MFPSLRRVANAPLVAVLRLIKASRRLEKNGNFQEQMELVNTISRS